MESKELLKHVKYMKNIIKNTNPIPVLDYLMIKDGNLIVTNLEISITLKLGIKAKDCLIDLAHLTKVLPSLKGSLNFSNKAGKITLTDGKRTYKFQYIECDEFPKIPRAEKLIHTLTDSDVANIIKAYNFTAKDDLRPVMKGIYFDKKHIVSTDAHKLFFPKLSKNMKGEPFIVPRDISKLLKGFDSLELYQSETHVTFINGHTEITARVIDGKYPSWEAVIPSEFVSKAKIDRAALLDTIKAAMPCANTYTYQLEIKSVKNDMLNFKAEDIDRSNEFEENVKSENSGKMWFGVNIKFLESLVKSIDDKDITFEFQAANRAIIINKKALVMPVLLNN